MVIDSAFTNINFSKYLYGEFSFRPEASMFSGRRRYTAEREYEQQQYNGICSDLCTYKNFDAMPYSISASCSGRISFKSSHHAFPHSRHPPDNFAPFR